MTCSNFQKTTNKILKHHPLANSKKKRMMPAPNFWPSISSEWQVSTCASASINNWTTFKCPCSEATHKADSTLGTQPHQRRFLGFFSPKKPVTCSSCVNKNMFLLVDFVERYYKIFTKFIQKNTHFSIHDMQFPGHWCFHGWWSKLSSCVGK